MGGRDLDAPPPNQYASDPYASAPYGEYDDPDYDVPPRRGIRPRTLVAGALIGIVLGSAAVTAYALTRNGEPSGTAAVVSPTSSTARTTPTPPASTPVPAPSTPSPTSTSRRPTPRTFTTSTPPAATFSVPPPSEPTDDAQAIVSLNQRADEDERATPIDRLWVVQLDSKYVGVRDLSQQPTPFTAVDIWNRFQNVISDPRFGGQVRIVRDDHFGKRISQGNRLTWVALLDLDLPDKASAQAWCEATFVERGTDLANVCLPRQMTPPRR
ncbi:hypothetical protein [Luteipulveratus flavus]|uniref:Uncharacterized protein n=1 Tax=Luteipulveratus flavus TaxID=3031728 RepID=A0ABT6C8A0_9MICO|nr:hypothetical protein [Luteipulveratus sp. YIM 133296]MDF8265159.1 hypothetical protein [Luteipulveratus sp. YIM 133296]